MQKNKTIRDLFPNRVSGEKAAAAIFMSGSGTNAEVILQTLGANSDYYVSVIVTDAPETSRARELSERFQLPLIASDLRAFYRTNGESAIALTTDRRRELRERWTDQLRIELNRYRVDFGILAGFVPLCNITGDFPCLNVHPGDLTVENPDGTRRYAGLHFRPVETAILDRCEGLRSSVILAQTFCGNGKNEMDGGPVLGISPLIPLELDAYTGEQLAQIAAQREKPPYHDALRKIAIKNLERLKCAGDHVVFPAAIEDFAAGRFGIDDDQQLYYRSDDDGFIAIRTVVYATDGFTLVRA